MAEGSGQDDAEPMQLPEGFREEGLAYYEALKETLGRTHVKAASFLTGYLFLTASSDVRVPLFPYSRDLPLNTTMSSSRANAVVAV